MEKNKIKKATILTGALLSGAVLSVSPINAATGDLNSTDLGSGAEIRANLLGSISDANTLELTCGEKKDAEHKCGEDHKHVKDASKEKTSEHKCGEDHKHVKDAAKEKTSEHKCGEGKCGEKKETADPKN